MDPLDAPATKRDLLDFATKQDLADFATKQDLAELEAKLDAKLDALERSLAAEIARGANVMIEHMTSLFRVADDRITTVDDRVTTAEARLEDHATDATVHRAPRRRAR